MLNNAENPVADLTVAQIRDIYQGEITNWADRTSRSLLTPAVFGFVDAPKACFIPKQQTDFSTAIVDNVFLFSDPRVHFFEASITSALAFLGCLLRDLILRQSCRFSTR